MLYKIRILLLDPGPPRHVDEVLPSDDVVGEPEGERGDVGRGGELLGDLLGFVFVFKVRVKNKMKILTVMSTARSRP